jgi:glycerate-2-kinase
MHLKTAKRRVGGEKHCWIYGGETTVTIQGKGRGGRNQELALALH